MGMNNHHNKKKTIKLIEQFNIEYNLHLSVLHRQKKNNQHNN